MGGWLNFNGELKENGSPLITADSRAFRYGDGLFETIRFSDGRLQLKDLHFERLFRGMNTLQIKLGAHVNADFLETQILRTLTKNRLKGSVRVRLTVFRGEGGLYETDGTDTGFIVQVWQLEKKDRINENGLIIGRYEAAKKHCDSLANIKSNNYLLYAMAALHAKANRWNDCLVMNQYDRICDATIANVFWVKDQVIYTPPLSEGGVAGVMRRHLLEKTDLKWQIGERPATVAELTEADELFLTNAISGLRWVREFNGKSFVNDTAAQLYHSTF